MHLELVQALRCPGSHEDSWLVARTDCLEARHIVAGALGCPVCGAEYVVADGVVRLATRLASRSESVGEDAALRAAALLDLTTPNGIVLLAGAWSRQAVEVAALTEGIHIIALDAEGDVPPPGMGVSRIDAGAWIPLGAGVARGIALDVDHATASTVDQAAHALAAGGRLIAPVAQSVPARLAELARDDRWWVAQRRAEPAIVSLSLPARR